jgi:hypothetical protein
MSEFSQEAQIEFAAIFGYSEVDQVSSISVDNLAGTDDHIVTISHSFRSDMPITYKERTEFPSQLVRLASNQSLMLGVEPPVWLVNHQISRYVTPEEMVKCLAHQAKYAQKDTPDGVTDVVARTVH